MPRYLIEVAHENKKEACNEAVRIFEMTGSHFLTNSDWGCADDIHKSWIIADLTNKEQALLIVPPSFRQKTKIITLNRFLSKTINKVVKKHNS
ncbi:hypothetical protein A2954_00870 [Candidatus Roizmanbacteria bacterium RIFCSPLOWO2_01_FULL_37_12]|uniref:Uncharacterized protein n=1 Tax=Candidatus Roizmanbacteria bacterium RIFCSPLOWO2_01_FULL_37_12 TaxID=1802056 RepID=A0A1F7IGA3_9BACT|nr:MAG: hypothetical protein A3D76_01335 [Candidatus Roizmanbacteria bacterium RIFCSPHIGHO2_02_FULL_37_9b]OGK42380.1 MAG: hypothetical protein A2954_00870 [Candidatus Roizmanbacteria bacterium RIFCSPLOWO2_01_FULL_37_12]